MRFPSLDDLDREQKTIYGHAPHDENILVVGPPGTGKTIMAIHRAMKLKDLDKNPTLIMFNRVLNRYTNSGQSQTNVKTSTMHKWASDWWRDSGFSGPLPKTKKSDGSIDNFSIDWKEVFSQAAIRQANNDLKRISWGHLIIDEGQDFEKDMYWTLSNISQILKSKGIECLITVFADDNQRLNVEKNSTVSEIETAMGIRNDHNRPRKFYLRKNYRNTAQTYKFAKYFQALPPSDFEEMEPELQGEKPNINLFAGEEDIFEFLKRKIEIEGLGKQIGVITEGEKKTVFKIYKELEKRLKQTKISVQAYISSWKQFDDKKLDFVNNDTVTVLHSASAKGTEFDNVFYLGLENSDYNATEGFTEKMTIYVMSSRPRKELNIVFGKVLPTNPPDLLNIFPQKGKDLCRYRGWGTLGRKEEEVLKNVKWQTI